MWAGSIGFVQWLTGKKKKIQVFDSGGQSRHRKYLEALLQYLNDEHKAKKNSPLPDFYQWELVG